MQNSESNKSYRIEAKSGPGFRNRIVVKDNLSIEQAQGWMLGKFNMTTNLNCISWNLTKHYNNINIETGLNPNKLEKMRIGNVWFEILCENS